MRWSSSLLLNAIFLAAATPAAAAVDAFLQIEGVNGSSVERPGWVEVTSFQWGVGRGISSPTGGMADRESSAPSVSEIVITKVIDKASPLLSKCAASGCHYGKAVLALRKAGGGQANQPFAQYILTNVTISNVQMNGGGDNPTESLTLHFTKIEMQNAGAGAATRTTSAPTTALHPIGH